MKTSSLLVAVLAAGPVVAGPAATVIVNGVIYGEPPAKLELLKKRTGCNADNVLRALRNPTRSAGASVFCSEYLQSTSTICTTTIATSATTEIETSTVTTTTTALTTAASTTTVTCAAAPTSPATCGVAAFGFPIYLISSTPSTDPATCHERCLADPSCKSFQVQLGESSFCNLYNVQTAGNVRLAPGSEFEFYDRGCPEFLPLQCTSALAKEKRAYTGTTPTYLATVPASRISSACNCFITSPSAPATSTRTQTVTASTTATTTTTVTTVQTVTSTVSTTIFVITTAAP